MSKINKMIISLLKSQLKSYIKATIQFVTKLFPNSLKTFVVPYGIKSYKDFKYIIIYPSIVSKRSIPKTIHKEVSSRFLNKLEERSSESFVLCLPGGISTNSGDNLTESGMLIEEVSKQTHLQKQEIEKHRIFSKVKFFQVKKYDGSVATLTTQSESNYFHWLFNALPKIHLLDESGLKTEKIYVQVRRKFQEESLKVIGYESERIINSSAYPFLSASKLVIPSLPDYESVGNITAWSCDFLRKKILTYSFDKLDSSQKKFRKIYISRADAGSRKVINEPEVISFLQKYGFIVIKLEYMSFLDQVNLFKNAEVVVAPHGAGLSNLVFCSEKTKIIEIFAPNYISLCFWFISQHVGLDYYYLIGEGKDPLDYLNARFKTDNIKVDLIKLRETFELASISICS